MAEKIVLTGIARSKGKAAGEALAGKREPSPGGLFPGLRRAATLRHPLFQTLRELKGNPRACVFTEPLFGIGTDDVSLLVDPEGNLYDDRELWYPLIRMREEGAEVHVVAPAQGVTYKSKHGLEVVSDVAAAE